MRWLHGFGLGLGGVLLASVATAAPPAVVRPPVPRAPVVVAHPAPPAPPPTAAPAPLREIHVPAAVPELHLPPPSASRPALLAASKDLIARQAIRVRKLLPTSGVRSVAAIGEKVAALGPDRAAAVALLKSERGLEIVMRAPSGLRDAIARRGFLNKHETSSQKDDVRLAVEASFLGVSTAEYAKLPNTLKPKYAYLRPATENGSPVEETAALYGDDAFVFKREGVTDHATVFPEDSLGGSVLGYPPNAHPSPPEEWNHALYPWADRVLLAPHVAFDATTNVLRLDAATPGVKSAERAPLFTSYLEVQIWRPLGLENVERFEFAQKPPTGAFLAALRDNHVKIFRAGSREEWRGDEGVTRSGPEKAR